MDERGAEEKAKRESEEPVSKQWESTEDWTAIAGPLHVSKSDSEDHQQKLRTLKCWVSLKRFFPS